MNCDFGLEPRSDHTYRCAGCSRVIRSTDPPWRIWARCRQSEPASRDGPSPGRRLTNFTVAAIGHWLRGSPTCTAEEISQRLTICHACELFRDHTCTHQDCGCHVGSQQKYLNKLAWADQACPLGKWTAIDRPER